MVGGAQQITRDIKDIHFKSGFNIVETINFSSGNNQLDIGTDLHGYSTTAHMNTALAVKADDVAVAGGFASVNFVLGTKQDRLTTYSENITPNTYYINTDEPNGLFLSGWGASTNNTGYQTVPTGSHVTLPNLPTAGVLTFSFQLRGVGTKTDLVLTLNNSQTYTGSQEIKFTGLNSTFQTFTWAVNAYSTGIFNLHTYPSPLGSTLTQAAGSVDMRYIQLYGTTSNATISASLTCYSLTALTTVTCVSLVQTSDESIKQNIVNCDLDVIQGVFDCVEVKQYERTDVEGNRIGFIAQDLVKALPAEYDNITHMSYTTGNPLWGLDYARLTTILWGVCKNLQSRVDALESISKAKAKPISKNKKIDLS